SPSAHISARLAPLPPSRSRSPAVPPASPSPTPYTYFVIAGSLFLVCQPLSGPAIARIAASHHGQGRSHHQQNRLNPRAAPVRPPRGAFPPRRGSLKPAG